MLADMNRDLMDVMGIIYIYTNKNFNRSGMHIWKWTPRYITHRYIAETANSSGKQTGSAPDTRSKQRWRLRLSLDSAVRECGWKAAGPDLGWSARIRPVKIQTPGR